MKLAIALLVLLALFAAPTRAGTLSECERTRNLLRTMLDKATDRATHCEAAGSALGALVQRARHGECPTWLGCTFLPETLPTCFCPWNLPPNCQRP